MVRWADSRRNGLCEKQNFVCAARLRIQKQKRCEKSKGSEEANWRLVLALLYYRRQDTETVQNSGKIELLNEQWARHCFSYPLSVSKIACEAECCACTLKQVNLRRLPWFLLIDDSFCFTCQRRQQRPLAQQLVQPTSGTTSVDLFQLLKSEIGFCTSDQDMHAMAIRPGATREWRKQQRGWGQSKSIMLCSWRPHILCVCSSQLIYGNWRPQMHVKWQLQ
jgi:hypothetical protein